MANPIPAQDVTAHLYRTLSLYGRETAILNFFEDDPDYWIFQVQVGDLICGFRLARVLSLEEINTRVVHEVALQQRRASMYGARKGSPARMPSHHMKGAIRD